MWTFYGQFITPAMERAVERTIGLSRLADSTDPYLNDIPLGKWDSMHPQMLSLFPKDVNIGHGPGRLALGDSVVLAKTAARRIMARHPKLTPRP